MHPAQRKSILALIEAQKILIRNTEELLLLQDFDFAGGAVMPPYGAPPGAAPTPAAASAPFTYAEDDEEKRHEVEMEMDRQRLLAEQEAVMKGWDAQRQIFEEEANIE